MCICTPHIRTPWCPKCPTTIEPTPKERAEGVEVVGPLEAILRHYVDMSDDGVVRVVSGPCGEGFVFSYTRGGELCHS